MRASAGPTAHALVAAPFFDAARELGLPVEMGLELLGWSSDSRPGERPRIAHEVANRVLSWTVELSGRPDFGLLAAAQVEPGHFDLVELASRSEQTVGEALATLTGLLPIVHEGLAIAVERGAERSRLTVRLSEGLSLHPAGYDFIAGCLVIAGRRNTGLRDLAPSALHLPYPRPADAGYLERFFGARLRFGAAALTADLPAGSLDLPLLRSNARVAGVLREAARGLLSERHGPVQARTRELVAEHLGSDAASLTAIARAQHMSERTLRRRLRDEGASFRTLVDDVRRARALELLADPSRSTEQIASALGFSTAQAFHRAFRRWTGGTLQAWRARRRGGAGG